MKIFVTDGSPDGFFTSVFAAYAGGNCKITSCGTIQPELWDEVITVEPDAQKSGRVRAGIDRYDRRGVRDVLLVLRSCSPEKEQAAFEYIRRLMQNKAPISRAFNLDEVVKFNEIKDRVTLEAHRMKGFLRFAENDCGVLYAPYAPDNDITDLIMPHFAARLANQKFIIHDIPRQIAGIYNGSKWLTGRAGTAEICLSEAQEEFERLWKLYYESVNISSRPHEKQMKGYMPVRYWKFLPEKKGK